MNEQPEENVSPSMNAAQILALAQEAPQAAMTPDQKLYEACNFALNALVKFHKAQPQDLIVRKLNKLSSSSRPSRLVAVANNTLEVFVDFMSPSKASGLTEDVQDHDKIVAGKLAKALHDVLYPNDTPIGYTETAEINTDTIRKVLGGNYRSANAGYIHITVPPAPFDKPQTGA